MTAAKLLPLVMQLGEYLKAAIDHYALIKSIPEAQRPDVLTAFLMVKMEGWRPQVGGKALLDPATREAAARFLAGVAVNLSS